MSEERSLCDPIDASTLACLRRGRPSVFNRDLSDANAGHDSAIPGWFSGRPSVHGFNKSTVLDREQSGTCRIDGPEFCDLGEQRADTIAL